MIRRIRVLVIDDHRMFGDELRAILSGLGDIELLGTAESTDDALERLSLDPADVVVTWMELPGTHGIEAIKRLRQLISRPRVVVIAAPVGGDLVVDAIVAGASAFVPMVRAREDLLRAIRGAAAGELVLPTADFVATLLGLERLHRARSGALALLKQLTPREVQVLHAVARGSSTRDVARMLRISPETVRVHMKGILTKLGVHSRLEAGLIALRESEHGAMAEVYSRHVTRGERPPGSNEPVRSAP